MDWTVGDKRLHSNIHILFFFISILCQRCICELILGQETLRWSFAEKCWVPHPHLVSLSKPQLYVTCHMNATETSRKAPSTVYDPNDIETYFRKIALIVWHIYCCCENTWDNRQSASMQFIKMLILIYFQAIITYIYDSVTKKSSLM